VKKALSLLIGVIVVALSFIILYNRNMSKEVFSNNEDETKLVSEIPEENIKLYAINKDNGMYTKFLLEIGNMQRYFNWQNVSNPTFSPKLILSDLNKNGIKELAVILTNGTGTGVHTEEVHIIDTTTFQDYDVENPIHVIYKDVNTKISPKNAIISFDDETIVLDERYLESDFQFFDDIVFENQVHYEIKDNNLYVTVGAQVSPTSYIGEIEMLYYFQGKMYVVDSIKFIPIELK
jgi:hypothetical protein